jgi:hypothetical protein
VRQRAAITSGERHVQVIAERVTRMVRHIEDQAASRISAAAEEPGLRHRRAVRQADQLLCTTLDDDGGCGGALGLHPASCRAATRSPAPRARQLRVQPWRPPMMAPTATSPVVPPTAHLRERRGRPARSFARARRPPAAATSSKSLYPASQSHRDSSSTHQVGVGGQPRHGTAILMHTIGNRPPCRTAKASRTEGFSTDEHLLGTESAFQTPQQPGRDGDRITDIGRYVQRPLARTVRKRSESQRQHRC